MTNQNNELDELDEIVRRIHFSQASFNELTKEELYEDIGDDCLRVINKGKKAIQALYAPKPVENGELREQVLTEFKQVHKLAPADYTENCTNVVMSIIQAYTNAEIARTLERIEAATPDYSKMDSYNRSFLKAMYENTIGKAIQAERAKLKEVV